MNIQFKKIHADAVIPTRSHSYDAGFDMTAVDLKVNNATYVYTYHTGICVDIPAGYVGLLFPRSSIYKTPLTLANSVGVIDAGYFGEIMFKFRKLPNAVIPMQGSPYKIGDRIGQLIIMPLPEIVFEEVEEFLLKTDRGTGGFGSSGE